MNNLLRHILYYFKILKSNTFKNVLIVFFSQGVSKLLYFIAFYFILSQITQKELGIITLYQVITSLGSNVFLQGIYWFLVREISRDDNSSSTTQQKVSINNLVFSCFLLTTIITLSFSFIFLFFISSVSGLLSYKVLLTYWPILIIGSLVLGLNSLVLSIYQGKQKFKIVAGVSVAQTLFLLFITLLCLMFHFFNYKIALYVILLTPTVPVIFYFLNDFPYKHISEFLNMRVSKIVASILKLLMISKWYTFYSGFSTVLSQLDLLMISKYFKLEDMAVYSISTRFYNVYLILLSALSLVFLPKFSNITDVKQLRSKLLLAMRYTVPVALLFTLLLVAFSETIIFTFAGTLYSNAVLPLRILTVSAGLSLIFSPSAGVLFSLNRLKILTFSVFLANIVCLLGHYYITRLYGSTGAAVTTLITYFLFNFTLFVLALKLTNQKKAYEA